MGTVRIFLLFNCQTPEFFTCRWIFLSFYRNWRTKSRFRGAEAAEGRQPYKNFRVDKQIEERYNDIDVIRAKYADNVTSVHQRCG